MPTSPLANFLYINFGSLAVVVPYLWPRGEPKLRARVGASMALLVFAKVASVGLPVLYARAVDAIAPTFGAVTIATAPVALVLGYGLVRVLESVFNELRDVVFLPVQARARHHIARQIFHQLHTLSFRFHMERQTGGLARVIERGTRGVTFMLDFVLFSIAPSILEIVLVTFLLWKAFDIWLALFTSGTIILYVAFTLWLTDWRQRFRREMNQFDEDASAKVIDSLLNYETVKFFGNERHEEQRYDVSLARYEAAYIRSEVSLRFQNVGQSIVIALGVTAVMLRAAYGVAAGRLTVGDFVLVNTYLIQLYLPLSILGFVYREIKQSLTDITAMFQLMSVDCEIVDRPGALPMESGPGTLCFHAVRFSYYKDREILKGVSFNLPAGGTLAVVGPTGAGKSTISRLLFRFYDPSAGEITIDGQDIASVTQDSLHAAIGVVPQENILFNDTIGYNIAYGRPGATQAEIANAATLAQLHEFVKSLPDGYATIVGERGLRLSGGERQRIAIARTILKNPRILILDEATSALDSRTEQDIQAALDTVSAGRTTVVIAHRLSTVVSADQILVLRDGEVAECGRHEDLLRLNGFYAEMWRFQAQTRALVESGGQ